jgi:hypothetical protein
MKIIKLFILLIISKFSFADEGMWLPQLLQQLNEKQMKSLGMKINASDIYNINKGSLKDAIVSFGGFCTGEVISDKGLVLTNHHCGFDVIQNHSTIEHNYIKDGFWAKNNGEELPNPGLFVTFIVRIDDVSNNILNGITNAMAESERQSLIDKNISAYTKAAVKETYQDVMVRPFFDGNKYFAFVTETFRDVRLVGAPPSMIGNFGKDTDNWMWPRHTGDFSLFRIYAGKDNKPAAYSPDNVPYKPKKSLSISLSGVKEGDFTMVFGFPGRTYQYLPASAVEQVITVNNPAKIAIRDKALTEIDKLMRQDEQIKIQYASKYATIQNAYKKWQGEILGITRTKAIDKKRAYEAEFQKRVNANTVWKEKYGNVLPELNNAYEKLSPFGLGRDYYNEAIGRIELFTIAAQINRLETAYDRNGEKGMNDVLPAVTTRLQDIYKDYNAEVDKRVFASLIQMFVTKQDQKFVTPELSKWVQQDDNNYEKITAKFFNETDLDNSAIILQELQKDPVKFIEDLKKDPAIILFNTISTAYQNNVTPQLNTIQAEINQLQRLYTKAQLEVFKERTFYPDANSTLRVGFGKVKGYQPRDGVVYEYQTDLEGIMEKYVPGDYEFDVPEKLIQLYESKDYGKYGVNGKMPVCFIANNHTTGGNSGSPALDAYGNLIGINFDRVWEGTMSDLNYDTKYSRNIMVDARYILFIIDKFAGAGYLINEMKLVNNSVKK